MDNLIKSVILTPFNWLYRISPVLDLKILFRLKCGYRLNLKNPKTYNEKLQWIKLYDKNPLMPKCCDKFAVREYVKSKGCEEILNELLWEGFDPEEIPFNSLPNQYVIKVTHGSTFNIIVKDAAKLDRKKAVAKCKKWLRAKFLVAYGEWFYGVEKPRVIVEKYLDAGADGLRDYKVLCFNGKPRYIWLKSKNRENGKYCADYYDTDWNLLTGCRAVYPNSGRATEKPDLLEQLIEYSQILSKDFLHARIDFYIIKGRIIFGEITFTHSAGFAKTEPMEFALELGSQLKLPGTMDGEA